MYTILVLILLLILFCLFALIFKSKNKKIILGGSYEPNCFEKMYYNFDYDKLKKQLINDKITNSRNYLLSRLIFITGNDNTIELYDEEDRLIAFTSDKYGKKNIVYFDISEYNKVFNSYTSLGLTNFYTIQSYMEIYQDCYLRFIFIHYPGCDPILKIQTINDDAVDKYAEKYKLPKSINVSDINLSDLEMLYNKQKIKFNNQHVIFTSLTENNNGKLCNKKEFINKVQKQIKQFNIRDVHPL